MMSVKPGINLFDPGHIHQSRPVNAHKLFCIESGFDVCESIAQFVGILPHIKLHGVLAASIQSIFFDRDQEDRAIHGHRDSILVLLLSLKRS